MEIAYSQYYCHNVVKKSLVVILSIIIAGIALSIYASLISEPSTEPSIIEETPSCSGNAGCFSGTVTRVIDGDTIDVALKSVRLALTSTPELSGLGGNKAKQFTASICPVGSTALVDEDDGQTGGSFGRILAVVYCDGVNLNSALLESGLAYINTEYCSKSEFANENWARSYGC